MPLWSLAPLRILQERTVGVSVYRFLFRKLAFGRGRRLTELICDCRFECTFLFFPQSFGVKLMQYVQVI